jgi:hypothetical protein
MCTVQAGKHRHDFLEDSNRPRLKMNRIFVELGIVTCRVVRATKMTGSSSDDWIYYHVGYDLSESHLIQRYRCSHDLQFTVAHAVGFFVSTSRLLATDLNKETITSNHYKVFLSSITLPLT